MRSPASAKGRLKLGRWTCDWLSFATRDCSPCAKALASRPVFSAHARQSRVNAIDASNDKYKTKDKRELCAHLKSRRGSRPKSGNLRRPPSLLDSKRSTSLRAHSAFPAPLGPSATAVTKPLGSPCRSSIACYPRRSFRRPIAQHCSNTSQRKRADYTAGMKGNGDYSALA